MFQKATKKKLKARVALIGPPGSGKTYTSLLLAKALGTKIAVIDTERGSASKYSGDVADFDVCEPESFQPKAYVQAMHEAARAGYDVLVIDSLSHAWEGEGGILDQVDQRGGKFDAWRDMSPQTRGLIEAILTYPGHVIATLRVKTEWVVEKNDKGKSEPRKVGLAPKFKDGLEYEFDVVGLMDDQSVLTITKSRASALSGRVIKHPDAKVAHALRAWLEDGVDATGPQRSSQPQEPPPAPVVPAKLADCKTADVLAAWVDKYRATIDEKRREKVVAQALAIGVDEVVARGWVAITADGEVVDPSRFPEPQP